MTLVGCVLFLLPVLVVAWIVGREFGERAIRR